MKLCCESQQSTERADPFHYSRALALITLTTFHSTRASGPYLRGTHLKGEYVCSTFSRQVSEEPVCSNASYHKQQSGE